MNSSNNFFITDSKSKKKDEDEFDDTYVILEDGERVHISWVEAKTIKKEDGKYCVYSKNGKIQCINN